MNTATGVSPRLTRYKTSLSVPKYVQDEAPSTPEDGPAQLAGLTLQVCAASPLKKHNCLAAQQITATDSHRHVSSCL